MIFTEENCAKAAKGEAFFGDIKIDTDWRFLLHFLDGHPKDQVNYQEDKCRYYLKHTEQRPSLPYWARSIIEEMQKVFHKNRISNIAFFGFGNRSDSYPWHKDKMDVFLVQVANDVKIKVENLWEEPRKFRVGDYVYIPRGTHHQIVTSGSRCTFSFGVESEPNPITYLDS